MKSRSGFTIVELLIVIVVIAILAMISVVAYNGIQNRTDDAAIQADIRQIGQRLLHEKIETDVYPVFTGTTSGPGFKFPVNQNVYHQSGYNLYICQSDTDPQNGFAIAARSRSGAIFAWSSNGGFIDYATSWSTSSTVCPGVGYPTFNFTYGRGNTGVWAGWTK
jgi:prepilin-type N-terminal cleavage/methylation domain-containing protein